MKMFKKETNTKIENKKPTFVIVTGCAGSGN